MPPPEEGRGNSVSKTLSLAEDKLIDQVTTRITTSNEQISSSEQNIKLDDVFPNPFSNRIQLNVESSHERKLNTKIVNLSGQIVHNEDISISIGFNLKEIDSLGRLPSGIYFLVVVDGVSNEEISIQKIIKTEI